MLRIKTTPTSILEYILAILLVLECNSVYQRATEFNIPLNWMCVFVAFLLAVLTMSKRLPKKSLTRTCFLLFFSIIYLLLAFTKSNVVSFVTLFCMFFPSMLIYLQGKFDTNGILSIYEKFSNVVVWLTLISTIVWFLSEIVGVFSPNMTINIAWGTEHAVNGVFGLFFQTQLESTFGFSAYRNSGIFCEAPMFNLVACFSLIYELFLRKNRRKKFILILVLGILSSITSTGFVMLGVCLGLIYWNRIKTKQNSFRIVYIVGMLILLPIAFVLLQFLFEAKSVTGSYSIRLADYIVGFNAFLSHPLSGTGFDSLSNLITDKARILAQLGRRTSSMGFSNSITGILGQGGIFLFIIYTFPFFAIIKEYRKETERDYTAWVISFFILFSVAIFHARFIMIYFLAFAYATYFLKKPNSKKIFTMERRYQNAPGK